MILYLLSSFVGKISVANLYASDGVVPNKGDSLSTRIHTNTHIIEKINFLNHFLNDLLFLSHSQCDTGSAIDQLEMNTRHRRLF